MKKKENKILLQLHNLTYLYRGGQNLSKRPTFEVYSFTSALNRVRRKMGSQNQLHDRSKHN